MAVLRLSVNLIETLTYWLGYMSPNKLTALGFLAPGGVVFKVFYDNGRRGHDIVRKLKMEVLHVY